MISAMPLLTPDDQATILVIEDNQATADLVYEVLDQEGYRVRRALSGEAGLALMEEERADLVLLDVMLPGMDGFEICRRLKARWSIGTEGSFLPIVMLTARGSTHDVLAGLEAGADEYLRKPFELDELLLRVRAMLRIVYNERALARRNAELEAAYEKERRTRRRLEALEAVTAVGLSDLPLETMLSGLIEKLTSVTGADAGAILLPDADTGQLRLSAAVGMPMPAEVQLWSEAVETFVEQVSQGSQTVQAILPLDLNGNSSESVSSLLAVPLMVRGRRLGVACLARGADRPFQAEEKRLFEIMANRAALAIENAALVARAEHDAEMKTLLLRELQHRVRNNLQAISGILSFQLTRETTAQAAITGALRRIKSISATQDFLFKREGNPIPMRPLLEVVAQQLAGLWALPGQTVQVSADTADITLSMERAQLVAIVVHELIANAFQHGLLGQPGTIQLAIATMPDGISFAVTDPGAGFPPDFDIHSPHLAGLKLVQILLEREFRISLHIHSYPGATRVAFVIPLSYFPAGQRGTTTALQDRVRMPTQ